MTPEEESPPYFGLAIYQLNSEVLSPQIYAIQNKYSLQRMTIGFDQTNYLGCKDAALIKANVPKGSGRYPIRIGSIADSIEVVAITKVDGR